MERMTLAQVGTLVDSMSLQGQETVMVGPDVVIDSREVTPDSLFVALPGERVDGHNFVSRARQEGAAAAIVIRPVPDDLPQIVVQDALTALTGLATAVVADAVAAGMAVVGVTGSSGKTSTKDLLAQVLAEYGPTIAPPGSFNNELGHPLTAAGVDRGTRFLVSEMGARGPGHVAHLCGVTPPTVGIVLNVGTAHLGEFGSVDAIAKSKAELVEALGSDGWAVLNADDPRVAAMASMTQARIARWSTRQAPGDAELCVWASDLVADELQRYSFTLHAAGVATGSARVSMRQLGEHHVANALATATAALALGLDVSGVAAALSRATARSRWRMELTERADGLAVLNDAYNANPDSMAAALGALSGMRRPGGRLVAVLGDMLELGPDAPAEHRRVGALAADAGVDLMYATGELGGEILSGFTDLGGKGSWFPSKPELAARLVGDVQPADVVVLKASRGLGFETIADTLLAHDEGADR